MIENNYENGRIINDDCLIAMDKLIENGVKVDCVIADIPYGIITNTCKWDIPIPFNCMWERLYKIKKDKSTPIILFGKQPFTSALVMSNSKDFRYEIIWEKEKGTDFGNANRKPLNIHENISVFYEKQPNYTRIYDSGTPYKKINKKTKNVDESLTFKSNKEGMFINNGERTPTTVRRVSSVGSRGKKPLHPTQKPIQLLEWLVKSYSKENDIILDFTAGSMSLAEACINTNRKFICIEQDKHYYEIGINRIDSCIIKQ